MSTLVKARFVGQDALLGRHRRTPSNPSGAAESLDFIARNSAPADFALAAYPEDPAVSEFSADYAELREKVPTAEDAIIVREQAQALVGKPVAGQVVAFFHKKDQPPCRKNRVGAFLCHRGYNAVRVFEVQHALGAGIQDRVNRICLLDIGDTVRTTLIEWHDSTFRDNTVNVTVSERKEYLDVFRRLAATKDVISGRSVTNRPSQGEAAVAGYWLRLASGFVGWLPREKMGNIKPLGGGQYSRVIVEEVTDAEIYLTRIGVEPLYIKNPKLGESH